MTRYSTISFLSDFGHADEFVGVVHSVIRSIAPEAAVVDVTHGIRPHDVRAGALALARSAQYLCPGVVLAVVDPGVGTDRRAVAIEVGEGASVLVGPDNGLLASAVAMVGGASRAVELAAPELQLPRIGSTFDGRDVFAPAAAHIANGVDLADFGPVIDAASLMPGLLPVIGVEDGGLMVEVLWIDHYGNVQLNIGAEDLAEWGDPVSLIVGDHRETIARRGAYRDISSGEVGAVIDSTGLVSLAVNGGSAAEKLHISASDELRIEKIDGPPPQSTAVTLGRMQ
ncbi:MAG: SAM-dependent chlorinase/fluorinase [Acidimicrobiales bacterium]|nr:SAM-dependent chlorinase/fluorinase [Acidimicrobiales bacterium]